MPKQQLPQPKTQPKTKTQAARSNGHVIKAKPGDVIELPNGARVRMAQATDYTPDPHNPNLHTPRGQHVVETSMGEDGFARPVAASADGTIVAGNMSYEVAGRLFEKPLVEIETDGDVPIVHRRRDVKDAQSVRGRRLAVADNRAGEVSLTWSAAEIAALREQGEDILGSFFREHEVKMILAFAGLGVETPGEFPEVGDNIAYDFACPKCSYKWSGKAR